MAIKNEDKLRIMIYLVVILVILAGGGLFYLFWSDAQKAAEISTTTTTANKKYSGLAIDSSVTKSEVFNSLKEVTPGPLTTSTLECLPGSPNYPKCCPANDPNCSPPPPTCDRACLDKIPRRMGNPFAYDNFK